MKKVIVMLFACSSTALLFSGEKKDRLKKSQENLGAIVVFEELDLKRSQSPLLIESTNEGIKRSPSSQNIPYEFPGSSRFAVHSLNTPKPVTRADQGGYDIYP